MINPIMSQNIIQRFQEFKRMFTGDPKQQVQQLLNSGRMSNEQFQQLSRMATELQNMMK